jgi:hypothetical protein
MSRTLAIAFASTCIAMAIVETITTPTPGLGYGRVANVVSLVIWTVTLPIIHLHYMI